MSHHLHSEAPPLWEIEVHVSELTSKQTAIPYSSIRPNSRLLEDLHIDSLDMVELILAIEEEFGVTIPDDIGRQMKRSGNMLRAVLAQSYSRGVTARRPPNAPAWACTPHANGLPLASVTEKLGISPFGLHHMAGNVWQWCVDWYASDFYQRPEARRPNPQNTQASGVRCERGGSWIGPGDLARSSYRRGRPPAVRGRCLGFRCVGLVNDLQN